MMTARFQTILVLGILLILLCIFNMIRRRKLELKYSLVWLVIMIILLVIACVPDVLTKMANSLGIYSPVNMIFFLGFVFSLVIIFVLTVTVSRLSARIRRLAQILAMLNNYMGESIEEDMKEKIEKEVEEIVSGDK